ncbi:MAG: Npt1/Npt2 family nucleotide transporter, partial [Candidatus Tectimicrobiota bacterium]
ILSAQSRYMLVVVFWVIGNDLFTYRQTKRLFPSVQAGGVLGVILGSAASGPLGRLVTIDNLLVVAGLVLLGGVIVTYGLERQVASVLAERPSGAKRPMELGEGKVGFGEVLPLIRESRFLQLLVVLVVVPNFLMPIFNYQWSVILDRRFVSEDGLLMFYAFFKAINNFLNLGILLFIGRAFTRFGVTAILLFHPANYVILFGALLGSFTLPVGIYGRISSNILRTSANRPAMYMLFNLLPPEHRGRLVTFFQGPVGRMGTLAGAAVLLAGAPFVDPRLFGLVGCLGAGLWLAASWGLSRAYTGALFERLMAGHLDFEALEQMNVRDALDRPTVERLLGALEGDEATASLAAEFLAETADAEVARRMVALVPDRPEAVQLAIVGAVGRMGEVGLAPELEALAGQASPAVAAACVAALGRTDPVGGKAFLARCLAEGPPPVRAQAAAAIYGAGHDDLLEAARGSLRALLSGGPKEQAAALEAIPQTGDGWFVEPLVAFMGEAGPPLKGSAARALGELRDEAVVGSLVALLDDASPEVRRQAALALGAMYAEAV